MKTMSLLGHSSFITCRYCGGAFFNYIIIDWATFFPSTEFLSPDWFTSQLTADFVLVVVQHFLFCDVHISSIPSRYTRLVTITSLILFCSTTRSKVVCFLQAIPIQRLFRALMTRYTGSQTLILGVTQILRYHNSFIIHTFMFPRATMFSQPIQYNRCILDGTMTAWCVWVTISTRISIPRLVAATIFESHTFWLVTDVWFVYRAHTSFRSSLWAQTTLWVSLGF